MTANYVLSRMVLLKTLGRNYTPTFSKGEADDNVFGMPNSKQTKNNSHTLS